MKNGDLISCTIIGFQEYGVFVKYNNYEGLVHISEVSDFFVKKLEDIFQINESILVLILDVDHYNKRLRLSYKQAHPHHPKILKEIKIIRGFTSLKNQLSTWIDEQKGE